MSTTHQINVFSDKFSPKATDVSKGSSDTVQFVRAGGSTVASITITAPSGTDASSLFGTTTCSTGATATDAPVYTVQSTAAVGVTYTLNLPAGVEEAKDPGTIIVTG
jgi:hypothetical protein